MCSRARGLRFFRKILNPEMRLHFSNAWTAGAVWRRWHHWPGDFGVLSSLEFLVRQRCKAVSVVGSVNWKQSSIV